MVQLGSSARRPPGRLEWTAIAVLVLIIVVSATIRFVVDWPLIIAGGVPDPDAFERRYVLHPILGYAHIVPALIYLLGAPLQLSRRFRERHFTVHRRLGRILLPCGLIAGVFAIIFGVVAPFGRLAEAAATMIFGVYFVAALTTAFLAIRRGDVDAHRRWMIRAYAVGLAVGTIRIWVGILQGTGLLAFDTSFGVAFWISFPLHALIAEIYLSRRPLAYDSAASVAGPEIR